LLNVRPKDLLSRAASMAPVERRAARARPALRRVPPSWRACRLTMSRAHFLRIVVAWIGALAILLAVALTVHQS
jgi:hypothetical protein